MIKVSGSLGILDSILGYREALKDFTSSME